ncbi:glycoprotein 3-alpha-L-fucosyltransferase A [Patella vulgata]|uniref:glycoprotein 3-alpha-L-fucosyltransferase A n=1 Tax=Patella vulgata TaxID=6465 RepID=UPI00217FAFC0|nr:glycoprotein 3-alpha-L-fucosyltransferase A [Patella vulgata]
MRSLYLKFIGLIVGFVFLSLGFQWFVWKHALVQVSKHADAEQNVKDSVVTKICEKSKSCNVKVKKLDTLAPPEKQVLVVPSLVDLTESVPKKGNAAKGHQHVAKVPKLKKLTTKTTKVVSIPKLTKPQKGKTQIGATARSYNLSIKELISNIILSKSGLPIQHPKHVGIWNTKSGSDRIVEQMCYIPKSSPISVKKPKLILTDGGSGTWGVTPGSETFKRHKCPVQNCEIINTHPEDGGKIDALLLGQFLPDLENYIKLYRKPEIVWLFFCLESPRATTTFHLLENLVNWTATYRSDSTIVAPYEKWVPHQNLTAAIKPKRNYAEGKTKMTAMFVSNCASSNDRLYYAYDLQKNITVDIYGYCGTLKCPRNAGSKCFEMMSKVYKFYLAFENANCKDYITEKFFVNGLQHDVIPVVMGARKEDYEKVAPPNSFIHVDDFKSPEELAAYLQKLDQNDDLYNQYFKWKGTGNFLNTKFWCRLCALLNDENRPNINVNLEEWWRSEGVCTKARWKT